jgi:hypothetical protein
MCEQCQPGGPNRGNSWPIYDGHGIYLSRVCDACEAATLAQFRPDILDAYDTDEQIDAEPDYGGAFDGFNVTSDADPGL